MYLKEIRAVGFKSFADKISLELSSGINGIVGPNGSGKSNVVDAVRWVLGEQSIKSLRGEGLMSDVIFSGSKSRNSQNHASVTLVFDNTDRHLPIDYSEVSIKRRIFRSGENEYYLNGEKCRLKDITDLFIDSGSSKEAFNIISQGEITKILSDKPEDRRVIFEEAAGVLKYKKRKEEAIKKLSRTHDNMTRVNDILGEIESNLEPLKIQSEKALLYLTKKRELEQIEISVIANDIEQFNYEYQTSKNRIEELGKESIDLSTTISNLEATLESEKVSLQEVESKINQTQSFLMSATAEVERLNGEKNLARERIKNDSTSDEISKKLVSLSEQQLELETSVNKMSSELELKKSYLEDAIKKNNSLGAQLKDVNVKRHSLTSDIESYEEKIFSSKKRISLLEAELENGNNLPRSVKSVINNPKIRTHGVVSSLIDVKEGFDIALDIALGANQNVIVVDTKEDAKDGVNYLKNNNLGRATFYPIEVIMPKFIDVNSKEKIKNDSNYIGVASDLVTCDSKYRNIILNLLGNVIVVNDIDTANRISSMVDKKYRIVTKDGEVVNVGGSITGGSVKKSTMNSEKYEIDELKRNIFTLEEKLEKSNKELDELNKSQQSLSNSINDIILEIARLNEEVKYKSSLLNNEKSKLESIKKEISSFNSLANNTMENEEIKIIELLKSKEQEKIELMSRLESFNRNKEMLNDNILDIESNIKLNNSKLIKINEESHNLEINVNRLDVKLDNLLNTLTEEYSMTFDKAKENYKLEIDVKEAKKQVASLRNIINNIGEVNTGSIEEYERVSERYEFLNKQRDDLVNAENVLLEIIDEMDKIMNEKFTTTFKEINEEFKLVFRQLFNGGDANLKLSDETNILETGIEISACPAGKNLKSISLLSGGEKTLTAISLLFAILRVRPVPFCILDEVEAALDEVNVDNFGRYLSIFRNKTQFIVITHKKKTMEYADCLYGITMQESGVSKLVSVKLEDVKA